VKHVSLCLVIEAKVGNPLKIGKDKIFDNDKQIQPAFAYTCMLSRLNSETITVIQFRLIHFLISCTKSGDLDVQNIYLYPLLYMGMKPGPSS
jgi:hypothetical protein